MTRSILVLAFTAIFFTADAQKIWTLEDCIEKAMATSISTQLSELGLKQSEINVESANHAKYPNLNANSGLQWNFGRTIDPVSNEFSTETFFANNVSLNSNVILYNGGRIKNTVKQSKLQQKAAQADHDQLLRDLSIQIAASYLNAIFALENKKINENQLKLSQAQLNQTEILIKNGVRPANESLDIQAQIARENQNIILSENNYQNALLQLKQILRLNPSENIQLEIPNLDNLEIIDPFLTNFDEVYQIALQSRPDIAAGEFNLERSMIAKKIAESGKVPTLSFGGSLGTNYSNQGRKFGQGTVEEVSTNVRIDGVPAVISAPQFVFGPEQDFPYLDQFNDNLSYGFGFGLNVPIYNNLNVKHNIQRSELDIEQIKLNNEQIKDNLKTNIQQALADAQAGKLALEASESALEAQKASFKNSEKRYELGAINSFEFVSARNLLDNAEINFLISKYDYIYKIKVLEFYMGKPIKLN